MDKWQVYIHCANVTPFPQHKAKTSSTCSYHNLLKQLQNDLNAEPVQSTR